MKIIIIGLCLTMVCACQSFDTSKIIEPTDYQIQSVSFNLSKEVIPTNMAAQKIEDSTGFTLVGAKLKQGDRAFVALWLFNTQDSSDIRSINHSAEEFSNFPHLTSILAKNESSNLTAFLERD